MHSSPASEVGTAGTGSWKGKEVKETLPLLSNKPRQGMGQQQAGCARDWQHGVPVPWSWRGTHFRRRGRQRRRRDLREAAQLCAVPHHLDVVVELILAEREGKGHIYQS